MIIHKLFFAEITKVKRLSFTWISLSLMILTAFVLNGFMWLIRNPEISKNLGILGQKAQLSFGGMDIDMFVLLSTCKEVMGLGSLLLSSFILTWIFGREYLAGTVKELFVLPVKRSSLVVAKTTLAFLWLFIAMTVFLIAALAFAFLMDMPSFDYKLFISEVPSYLFICLLAFFCSIPTLIVVVVSKGVFAPLGYALGSLLLATLFGNIAWGPYIPWSTIAIVSGAAGSSSDLSFMSYLLVLLFGLTGLLVTCIYWEKADHYA